MSADVAALEASLSWIQPELVVVGFALTAAVLGAMFRERAASLLAGLGVLALIAAGALALRFLPAAPLSAFGGALSIDAFSALAKAIIAFSAALTLFLAADAFAKGPERRFETPVLIALSVAGFFVMASANDLITLYIGVELQSLAAYALAAYARDDARSSEAGLKYFVLGALSSGLLLYGASLIYGFSGSIRFDEIAIAVASGEGQSGLIFGLVFLICALAFKMSAAPFHMWTPDVYEGAPTPVTAFFAAAPKLAAIALLARVLYGPFLDLADQWRPVVAALAALSLLVGAFAALIQTNIKRLMAYSSIANMGWVLMALAAGPERGAAAALIYMALYLPATIGVFALIVAMRRGGAGVEQVDDLAGLARARPWAGLVLTALLFSVTGIPPLAGFFGKLFAFEAALGAGLVWLAVVGAVAAVAAAGYYLRILAVVWFRPQLEPLDPPSPAVAMVAWIGALASFPVLVVALGWIEAAAQAAAVSSFTPP